MTVLTNEQQTTIQSICSWYGGGCLFGLHRTIGGFAGTGKTFLIGKLRKELKSKGVKAVAFVTFTGKASSVLYNRVYQDSAIYEDDFVGTIHSMMYRPEFRYDGITKKQILVRWIRVDQLDYDVIIIDEASMVGVQLWNDLIRYNIPIIAIGDHGQLPPVGDNGFNLMSKPDFVLKEIHRQARKSPIIQLSINIRKYGYIPINTIFNKNVFKISWNNPKCEELWKKVSFDENTIALTGFNKSRVNVNNDVRQRLKFKNKIPYPGERVICLKNNHITKIMNGQIGTLVWAIPQEKGIQRFTVEVDNMNEPIECLVHGTCFGKEKYDNIFDSWKKYKKLFKETGFDKFDFFDYGYCTSVHKSQGSEWNRVILFEQRSSYWDDEYFKRWLYTGVTRAKEKLFIISDFY